MEQPKFEAWAILELFGHNRIAGKVTEATIAGGAFIRVDVPDTKESPAFTRFLGPSSIYAINPVTEEVARGVAEAIKAKPIDAWDAREVIKRIDEQRKLEPAKPTRDETDVDYEDERDEEQS